MEYRTNPPRIFLAIFFSIFGVFFIYFSVKVSHTESENGACGVRRASRVRRRCVSGASARASRVRRRFSAVFHRLRTGIKKRTHMRGREGVRWQSPTDEKKNPESLYFASGTMFYEV